MKIIECLPLLFSLGRLLGSVYLISSPCEVIRKCLLLLFSLWRLLERVYLFSSPCEDYWKKSTSSIFLMKIIGKNPPLLLNVPDRIDFFFHWPLCLLRGFIERVYWEGLLRGFIERVYWEGLLRGFIERAYWEGLLRGFIERVSNLHSQLIVCLPCPWPPPGVGGSRTPAPLVS